MPAVEIVYVAYATRCLDLDWVPDAVPVTVVRNDRTPLRVVGRTAPIRMITNRQNVGFGRAINQAVATTDSDRIVICNPDTVLRSAHWEALAGGTPDQVITVALRRADGRPTAVVEPYPRPVAVVWKALANGTGVLTLLPSAVRAVTARHARASSSHRTAVIEPWSRMTRPGLRSLREVWICGAAFSVDRVRFLEVGGFDPCFFLYFEDTDFCGRLAARYPDSVAVVADVVPGEHHVSGSARSSEDWASIRRAWRQSAFAYAARQPGWRWRLAAGGLRILALPDTVGRCPTTATDRAKATSCREVRPR